MLHSFLGQRSSSPSLQEQIKDGSLDTLTTRGTQPARDSRTVHLPLHQPGETQATKLKPSGLLTRRFPSALLAATGGVNQPGLERAVDHLAQSSSAPAVSAPGARALIKSVDMFLPLDTCCLLHIPQTCLLSSKSIVCRLESSCSKAEGESEAVEPSAAGTGRALLLRVWF